jgi:molecular chaperone DnaK
VTVIELQPGHLKTLATDGDVRLGGRDWDERLANFLAEQFHAKHGTDPRQEPSNLIRLMRAVEEAKHTLTARTVANVHLECGGKSIDLAVTRETFEQLTEDLLERTAFTTKHALHAAGTSWQYISHILLVGGSTRMPMVSKMLERASGGMKPEHIVNPDEAVARGAAIYAGSLMSKQAAKPTSSASASLVRASAKPAALRVTNVNSHSLGIEGIDQETQRKENIILIPKNSPLPRRVKRKFVTRHAGQQSVVVQVLEGESKSPLQCTRVARAVLRNLPSMLPQGSPIEVLYEYGSNGRLNVRAKLPQATHEVRLELERDASLSNDRIARWKQVVSEDSGFDAFEAALEEALLMANNEKTSSA